MTKRISDLTQSQTLSGGELFEGVQNSTSVAVSAGEIRTFVESTSVVTAFKNKIINGNFDIWQRNTTQTSTGYSSDDRWKNSHNGTTKTHSRQTFTLGQTDVPNNPIYYSRTVVSSSAGASNYCLKEQRMESVSALSGETVTFSFYAKADASKDIAVEFAQVFGTGGSPSAQVTGIGVTTFTLTTSWQKFTATVDITSISGKTLGSNGDDYLSIIFWFDAGSDFNSRTNSLGQQSGTFDIAKVQVERGKVATEFDNRPIAMELPLCQRYYQKNLNLSQVPANNTYNKQDSPMGTVNSATAVRLFIKLHCSMRIAPSMTYYSSTIGTPVNNQFAYYESAAWTYGATSTVLSHTDAVLTLIAGSGLTVGDSLLTAGVWAADAEL